MRPTLLLLLTLTPALAAQTVTLPSTPDPAPTHLARTLAEPVCAGGCSVLIPQTYPYGAEQSPLPLFPINLPLPRQSAEDHRGGGRRFSFNDTAPPGPRLPAESLSAACQTHTAGYEIFCGAIRQRLTVPGWAFSNSAGAPSQWFISHTLALFTDSASASISSALNLFQSHNGTGDTNNYLYVSSRGGARDASGERHQGLALHSAEALGEYTGTVLSTTADTVATAPTANPGSQGVGRYLIDTSTPLATGCITAQSTLPGEPRVTVYTLGCGAAPLPVSHCFGTLASGVRPPFILISGTSPITTPTPITVNLLGGPGCTPGDRVNLAGDNHETALVLTTAPPANNQQTLTLALSRPFSAGTFVMQSGFALGGLDLLANHGDAVSFGGPAQRYALDTLGAISPNQVVATFYFAGGPTAVPRGNLRLDTFATFPSLAVTNTAGIVSLPVDAALFGAAPFLDGYPLLTLASPANSAFNGPCLHPRRVTHLFPAMLQCDQPASIGQTTASATFTLGATGYGNGQFTLYPMAEVLDVQRYDTLPPTMDGTFRLQPNALPLRPGDTVVELNDVAAGYKAVEATQALSNVLAGQYSTAAHLTFAGAGATAESAVLVLETDLNPTQYTGFGGIPSPPTLINGRGLHSGLAHLNLAPWPSGSPLLSVDCAPGPRACDTPTYTFPLIQVRTGTAATRGAISLDAAPADGTLTLHATHLAVPDLPSAAPGKALTLCLQTDPTTHRQQIVTRDGPCNTP